MRLRFIKPWSTYRIGDVMVTESPTTVEVMVNKYKLAVLVDEPRRFESVRPKTSVAVLKLESPIVEAVVADAPLEEPKPEKPKTARKPKSPHATPKSGD